jgi:cytoskeletal protein CcmA (bactofilin family)
VRIDGNLEGNITTSGNVIIGEGGRFTGKIISNNFHLFGYFKGVADVAMRTTVHKTGEFHGNMITETIHIESGGILDAPTLQMRNLISQLQPSEHKTEPKLQLVNDETVVTNNVRHLRRPVETEDPGSFQINNSRVSYRINSSY